MPTLTLGISPCPNDVFIFSGLLLGQVAMDGFAFSVDFQDVETLNQRAQQAELDVLKISYANYIHCEAQYELLACGGALGRGVGPLLLVNAGEEKKRRREEEKTEDKSLNAQRSTLNTQHPTPLLVPGANTTANFLLDFYTSGMGAKPLEKRFLPFDTLYNELVQTPNAQGVVIHEKRFTYRQDGLTLVQDLGEYWEQQTGYAIPLGAICVRKSLHLAAPLTVLIQRSLAWAQANYDAAFALCQNYAQDLSKGVIEAHIRLYVNAYSENLGVEGEAAVRFFLEQQRKFAYANLGL